MPEMFMGLPLRDRRALLEGAAATLRRSAFLLEKDVWVVWALQALFDAPFGTALVFKGGTSLSKAHQVITRFSEDVDVTRDIRTLIPELASGEDPIPASGSQARKWRKIVEDRLASWVREEVAATLEGALARDGASATLELGADRVAIRFEPVTGGGGYVRPEILLEFGGRATGEPAEPHLVRCDLAPFAQGVVLPEARPRVMTAERTFWEKATAVHAWCLKGEANGERLSRHWYDLVALDGAGVAARALADRSLGTRVARHKQAFFEMKDAAGEVVEYARAIAGGLQLVPQGPLRTAVADDYQRMVGEGMLPEDAPRFEALLAGCADLECRANTPNGE